MKVTIIKNDSVVLVDGRAIKVDLSDFPANVHAVQFDGANGHVEYNDGKANTTLKNLETFQTWVDRWTALRDAEDAPPPPDPPEVVKEKQRKAIDKQRDLQLASGFTHDDILWHCDQAFQAQVQGFILAFSAGVLPPQATVTIRSKSNTNHALTQAQVIALAAALMVRVQGIYAASWAAKDAL